MARYLLSKYRRILNPKPYIAKSFSNSDPAVPDSCQNEIRRQTAVRPPDETDAGPPSWENLSISDLDRRNVVEKLDDSQRSGSGGGEGGCLEMEEKGIEGGRVGDDGSCKDLKNFVEKLMKFEEEKVRDDGMSVRKRMLAKMRAEWKTFRDGGSCVQKMKMPEDKKAERGGGGAEFGAKEKRDSIEELGCEEKGDGRILEVEKRKTRSRRAVKSRDAWEEDQWWTVELGEMEEKGDGIAEERDVADKELSDGSDVELGEMEGKNRRDVGIVEMMERKGNYKKDEMIVEWRKMEENERRPRRRIEELRGMEEKESRLWTLELGEVEEKDTGRMMADGEFPDRCSGHILPVLDEKKEKLTKSCDVMQKMKNEWNAACSLAVGTSNGGVQKLQTLDNEKGRRERLSQAREMEENKIVWNSDDDPMSSNLKDTLQMLKTAKKEISGKGVKGGLTSSEDECKKLEKLQNDVDEEKKQFRLNCKEVLRDCLKKLHNAMLEEEKHIRSKCDEVLRKSLQLQHEVQDERKHLKSTFDQLLMESYPKLLKWFQEHKGRFI